MHRRRAGTAAFDTTHWLLTSSLLIRHLFPRSCAKRYTPAAAARAADGGRPALARRRHARTAELLRLMTPPLSRAHPLSPRSALPVRYARYRTARVIPARTAASCCWSAPATHADPVQPANPKLHRSWTRPARRWTPTRTALRPAPPRHPQACPGSKPSSTSPARTSAWPSSARPASTRAATPVPELPGSASGGHLDAEEPARPLTPRGRVPAACGPDRQRLLPQRLHLAQLVTGAPVTVAARLRHICRPHPVNDLGSVLRGPPVPLPGCRHCVIVRLVGFE